MPQLVLLKPHTHAGKPGAIGDRIEVDASTAEWLMTHAVAVIAEVALITELNRVPQTVTPESKTLDVFEPHQPTHSNQRKEPKS